MDLHRGPVYTTCMHRASATAHCSRRSPGTGLLRAGSLLGRVVFSEGSWIEVACLFSGASVTVRVSNGYMWDIKTWFQ